MSDEVQDESDLIQFYPPWRNAIAQAALTPGTLLTYEELFDWFEIVKPTDETPKKISEKAELQFLGQMTKFQDALLVEKQIALRNVVGAGYMVVKPSDQGQWGVEECLKEVRRAIRKGYQRVIHTNIAVLSSEERQRHADQSAKMSAIAALFTRRNVSRTLPQELPGEMG